MSDLRVLLADDQAPLRTTLADVLRDEGIEVVGEAGDGHAAVSAAVRLRPDVLVIDLRMPGMDGIDATRTIRSLDLDMRVVVLSAYDDAALKERAAAAGADAYLVKGCTARDVVDALAREGRP